MPRGELGLPVQIAHQLVPEYFSRRQARFEQIPDPCGGVCASAVTQGAARPNGAARSMAKDRGEGRPSIRAIHPRTNAARSWARKLGKE